jgi:hypothetical protein
LGSTLEGCPATRQNGEYREGLDTESTSDVRFNGPMHSTGDGSVTFILAIGFSLLRSILIAIGGTFLAMTLAGWLRSSTHRGWLWGLLLLPFFTPSLLTGYCYRDTAMSLVHVPLLREVLYGLLVAAQSIPVAVLLLRFAPPPHVSDTALHGWTLFRPSRSFHPRNWRLILGSRFQSRVAAGSILFLLSFQEADLATLLQASTWTEWMFTRHAGGLALSETLRLMIVPVLIQLPFLVPVVLWIARQRPGTNEQIERAIAPGRGGRWVCRCWVAGTLLLVCLIPLWQLVRGARQGLPVLWEQPSLPRELGDALLLAMTAGLGTIALGSGLLSACRRLSVSGSGMQGQPSIAIAMMLLTLLLVPGCLGNLALGVSLAAMFQWSPLHWAYDGPGPLILGEILHLLPRTMILLSCLAAIRTETGEHFQQMLSRSDDRRQRMGAGEVAWRLRGRIRLAVILIVCFWGYLEVMLPSILAPPGMTPVGLVLYNALHYGRITALGAKLALALIAPMLLAGGFLAMRRIVAWSRAGCHGSGREED